MSTQSAVEHSVLDSFRVLRAQAPDRPLFTFVDERGRDEETLTIGGLAGSAEAIAEHLRAQGLAAGDRAVLVYPPGPDFVRALLGCLVAGVVPVPVYPPNPARLKHDLAGFRAIVESCRPRAALTNGTYERVKAIGSVAGLFDRASPGWPALRWIRTDRAPRPAASTRWHEPAGAGEPALLQYTSGSTSAPRGVVISHGNLVNEIRANARDLGLGQDTRGVFWLPQYHDFGLISVILSSTAGNSHTYLLSPLTFLQRPSVWFDVISRVRGTHSAAPNFAFDLAVRRTTPEQRAAWDLSSVRVLMSAAEPIRPATVEAFFTAFAPSGLRREAFCAAYGLAEHTVSVTMGGRDALRLDRAALESGEARPAGAGHDGPLVEVFGCGHVTKPEARLRVIDPQTRRPSPPHRIGEIWVDSPTKALGYHGLPAESAEAFSARVSGEADGTGYLRTGDLGFLQDGELYVTGRLKDLVIVNGRNVYPQDIEDAVREAHPSIRPGGLAAFATASGAGERLVLFVETREKKTSEQEQREIADAVRACLLETHQLVADTVVVGRQGLVRKTTSGKVRRRACRQAFDSGEIDSQALLVSCARGVQ